jgi:hypothetical protein
MKSELVWMRKEAVILSVEVVFKYLAEGTEANYEETVNWGLTEDEGIMLGCEPRHSQDHCTV